jgi:hypothetical protein
MTDLSFNVLDVTPERYAAAPNLLFRLRITEDSGATVHAIALRCQIRIEPQRRGYSDAEKAGLADLFGSPDRWRDTLKPFLWTHAATVLQGFSGCTDVDLPVTCTYDFDVAAAKYLHALRDGEVPLILLFSGTVFTRGVSGFAAEQIGWHCEATYRLPVRVWRELMDQYFPGSGWIRLSRETIDALMQFKSARGLPTWEQTFDVLLNTATEPVR